MLGQQGLELEGEVGGRHPVTLFLVEAESVDAKHFGLANFAGQELALGDHVVCVTRLVLKDDVGLHHFEQAYFFGTLAGLISESCNT